MIIDSIENSDLYNSLNPNFKAGFDFIKSFNPLDYREGKNEILGNEVFAIVTNFIDHELNKKLEVHNDHIDIHYVVKGKDLVGWKNRSECKLPEDDFIVEKDYQLFLDPPNTRFQVNSGEFVIFYPIDAHAPLMSQNSILKIVVKIKLH